MQNNLTKLNKFKKVENFDEIVEIWKQKFKMGFFYQPTPFLPQLKPQICQNALATKKMCM